FGNSSRFSQLTERASFLAHAIEHPAFEGRSAIDDAQDGTRQHQLNMVLRDCLVHSVERRLYRTEAVVEHVRLVVAYCIDYRTIVASSAGASLSAIGAPAKQ